MFVIVGSANVDLLISGFAQMPGGEGDEFTTSSLVFCDDPLNMLLGGNGANCAYVLAGLGAPTTLCSALGQDELGHLVAGWLSEQGVSLAGVARKSDHATAYTAIVTDRASNRIAFHHPGALAHFALADIPPTLLAAAHVLLITGYTIHPQLRPHGFAALLAQAKKHGTLTALDIGPAIGQPAQLAELMPLLPQVDYLLTNRHELAVCTGEGDLEVGAQRLLAAGARCVVIKQGKAGAAIRTNTLCLDLPAFAINTRSTVGAGDSFNAGLLLGLQQGWPLAAAARFANAVAALVVASPRGILGCPNRHQVDHLMKG